MGVDAHISLHSIGIGRLQTNPLAAMQARYENAYVHVMNVLKFLIDPSSGSGGLPQGSSLSDAERKAFLQTLLQACSNPSTRCSPVLLCPCWCCYSYVLITKPIHADEYWQILSPSAIFSWLTH